MGAPYRHEPLTPATLMTAVANLAILRTQAASNRRDLKPNQSMAAIRVAVQFERIVRQHATKRTTQ
jgi:hypothetical protein